MPEIKALNNRQQSSNAATMAAGNDILAASFDDLGVDVLANVLAFLTVEEIMRSRRVNKKSREAAKMAIVPPAAFWVDSDDKYNAMVAMTDALPNLQQIGIRYYSEDGGRRKYSDGEDPDEEEAAETADYTSHDIEIISNFSKLRILEIVHAGLNGRYPFLFNSFPLLQKLSIHSCSYLKWDLEMLAGLPVLKELHCSWNDHVTGNIGSLRVLKDTLERVTFETRSFRVKGKLMDLADFPHLKELNLIGTAVTGDIRDIGENHFSALESLTLPRGVYGGTDSILRRISDAPDLINVVYLFKKQHPALKMPCWWACLSRNSPDWYEYIGFSEEIYTEPPLYVRFVQAGSRIGYRWETFCGSEGSCEVNWLDPEPDPESIEYEKYIEDLAAPEMELSIQFNTFKGFHQPPTEAEYHRLIDGRYYDDYQLDYEEEYSSEEYLVEYSSEECSSEEDDSEEEEL